jgi:hypothetical protein
MSGNRMRVKGFALILAMMSAPCAEAVPRCYQYGPELVAVTGRIFLRTDFGPPGYGEDPATDSRERHIYIKLDEPLCADEDAEGEAEANVRAMEMVYFIHLPFKHEWVGKHVSVTGTLFHGITGHHWTKVLIIPSTTQILRAKQKASAAHGRPVSG